MEDLYSTYDYSYTTSTLDEGALAGFMALGIGLIIFSILLAIGAYVFFGIAAGKMFKKAGIPFWAAWVPFYNSWKLFEMGSFHGALSLLMLIPYVGQLAYMVLFFIAAYRIGLKFGKSSEFVLLAIFLSPIWLGILGFGKAQWNGGQVGTPTTPTAPAAPVQPQQ